MEIHGSLRIYFLNSPNNTPRTSQLTKNIRTFCLMFFNKQETFFVFVIPFSSVWCVVFVWCFGCVMILLRNNRTTRLDSSMLIQMFVMLCFAMLCRAVLFLVVSCAFQCMPLNFSIDKKKTNCCFNCCAVIVSFYPQTKEFRLSLVYVDVQ